MASFSGGERRSANPITPLRFLQGPAERLARASGLAAALFWLCEDDRAPLRLRAAAGALPNRDEEEGLGDLLSAHDLLASEGEARVRASSLEALDLRILGRNRKAARSPEKEEPEEDAPRGPTEGLLLTRELGDGARLVALLLSDRTELLDSLQGAQRELLLTTQIQVQRICSERRSTYLRASLHLLEETQRALAALVESEDAQASFRILMEALAKVSESRSACFAMLGTALESGGDNEHLLEDPRIWEERDELLNPAERERLLELARESARSSELRVGEWEKSSEARPEHFVAMPIRSGESSAVLVLAGRDRYYDEDLIQRCQPGLRSIARAMRMLRSWRKEAEAQDALRLSEGLRGAILDAAGDGVLSMDPSGRLVSLNRAAEEIFGYRADAILGRQAGVLLASGERARFRKELFRVMRGQLGASRLGPLRFQARRRGGESFSASIVLSRTDASARELVVCMVSDLSDQVELERRLRRSQKMEAVGQLAGGVAHDFNNLLTVILGYSQLLRRREEEDPRLEEGLSMIIGAATRAEELTKKLLAFGRKQVLRSEVFDLNHVLEDIGPMLRRLIGEDISMQLKPSEDPAWIDADVGQVEQILINLVVNARDAIDSGGSIEVRVRLQNLGEAEAFARGLQPGRFVELEVQDDGVGISEDLQDKVFEPFYTTKEIGQGTGLGLATVAGAVAQCQAQLELDSKLGEGACFRIRFPWQSAGHRAAAPAETSPVIPETGAKGRVLVVEDEAAVRLVAKRVLETAGYDVLEASNGGEALDVIAAASPWPTLVLSDIVMPGMGGAQLARHLRERYPALAIVLMTGHSEEAVRRGGEFGPEVRFLQKPLQADTLRRAVAEELARAHPPRPAEGPDAQQSMFEG
jgi:PAS domain S-box-containing protein